MPFEMDQILIGAAITAVLGTVGYFGKRRISRENQREKASLYTSYASIAATMKSQNLTLNDMESIEKYLSIGKQAKKMIENSDQTDDYQADVLGNHSNYWTQSAMNARAHASDLASEARLQEKIVEYRTMIEDYEQEIFDRLQENWENYRDSHAKIEASQAEGGSLEQLLFSAGRTDLNNQRTVAIESMINEKVRAFSDRDKI